MSHSESILCGLFVGTEKKVVIDHLLNALVESQGLDYIALMSLLCSQLQSDDIHSF